MSESEEIIIEDEFEKTADEGQEKITTEELKVKGEELIQTIKELIQETTVRRIVIKDKDNRVLIEVPLVLGLSGIILLPTWSALALVTALATDCSIVVQRAQKRDESPEE